MPHRLKESHYRAIACLAGGLSQEATAQSVGVSRASITRWLRDSVFSAELEAETARRAERAKQAHRGAADRVQDKEIEALSDDLLKYREALINAQKARIARGIRILNKVGARFDDLPEESIGIKEIAALLLAGDRLVSQGLESWGDAIAVGDLVEEMLREK